MIEMSFIQVSPRWLKQRGRRETAGREPDHHSWQPIPPHSEPGASLKARGVVKHSPLEHGSTGVVVARRVPTKNPYLQAAVSASDYSCHSSDGPKTRADSMLDTRVDA